MHEFSTELKSCSEPVARKIPANPDFTELTETFEENRVLVFQRPLPSLRLQTPPNTGRCDIRNNWYVSSTF
jgi:hypothetical protein